MECKKNSFELYGKFSSKKFSKFVKVMKPFLKFITRKTRTNAVTPSTCNYDVIESVQNDINETEMFNLQFKFLEEVVESQEADDNAKNEELERRLLQNAEDNADGPFGVQTIVDDRIQVVPVPSGTYFAVPVHFVESCPGKFTWAPLTDIDLCRQGDESVSARQIAEQQTAVLAA